MNDKKKNLWDNSLNNVSEEHIAEMAQTLYKKSLTDTDSDELIVVEEQKKNNRFIFVVAACVVALIGVAVITGVIITNTGIFTAPMNSENESSIVSEVESEESSSSTVESSSESEASKPTEERVYVELNEENVPYDENASFMNNSKKYYAKTQAISVLGYDFAVGGRFINNRKDSFSGDGVVLIFKDGKEIKGGGGFPSDGGQRGMKFDKKNPAAGLKVLEMTQNGKKYPLAIATSVSYNTTDEEVSGTYTRFTTVIDGEGYFFNSTRKSGIDGISPESVRNFTDNPVIYENTITDNDNGIRYTFDFETGGILIEDVTITSAPENDSSIVSEPESDFLTYYDFAYTIETSDTITITGYAGNDREIVIPKEIDGKKVTNIGVEAFANCGFITSVIIPDSVTGIGIEAFYNCESITSVTIPDRVTSIGDRAFTGCTSLTSITIPDSVTSIGAEAFSGCSFARVAIPDGVTEIADYTFLGCTSLTSVTIPDSVTSIGVEAFSGCSSLASVTIPDSITSIGGGAFSYCTFLTSITIPDSVTRISEWTFYDCRSLTSVTISDSVTSIGICAFYSCTSLTSVTIPDSVTSIGESVFSSCYSLTSVTIPDSVTSIGEGAFTNTATLFCHSDSYAEKYAKENEIKYEIIKSTDKTDDDIYNKYGHIKYTCDLSAFPVDDTRIWFGEIILIEDGRMLVSPGLDKGKTEFGEVVWLIDDYAYTYSVGQVVTYKYRDVKAPEKEGYPLSIIALLVYME